MRHGNKVNHLGRKTGHRKAMLSNMACSLIEHKRITTTLAKAKTLRVFVEPILTKSKDDSTHSRRVVFSYLQNKEVVAELFRDVAPKISNRNGGYTRIIRTGNRLGDNAEMCLIELVDFNEIYTKDAAKKTTRRSRRAGAKKSDDTTTLDAQVEVSEEATVIDENTESEVETTNESTNVAEVVASEEAPAAAENSESETPSDENENKEESAS
jgi:large subunit ribosomal protein L17